jgi:hypothetical protein
MIVVVAIVQESVIFIVIVSVIVSSSSLQSLSLSLSSSSSPLPALLQRLRQGLILRDLYASA